MTISPGALAALVTLLAALLTALGVLLGQLWGRLTALESRVDKAEDYSRRLWMWAREHIDLYYRHRKDGSPDPRPIPEND